MADDAPPARTQPAGPEGGAATVLRALDDAPMAAKMGAVGAAAGAAVGAVLGPLGGVAGALAGAQGAATLGAILDPPPLSSRRAATEFTVAEAPVVGDLGAQASSEEEARS